MQHFSSGLANAVRRKNAVLLLLPDVLVDRSLCSVSHACKAARSRQERSDTGEKRGARADDNQRVLFLTACFGMWGAGGGCAVQGAEVSHCQGLAPARSCRDLRGIQEYPEWRTALKSQNL